MKKKTKEEFISDSINTHKNKYDYSLVDYKNSTIKVKIICPKHGLFEQTPNNHISQKQGCPKCVGRNKSNDEYIAECKKVHGDKYDYSLVEYINNRTKIKIICPEHGEFEQEANSHLMGHGCFKCTNNYSTNEEFISKAKKVHGDKYDYSLVDYKNNKAKITIICSEHGEFEQEGGSHLSGNGCPKCVGRNKSNDEYIAECKKVHGDKYDYSLVDYTGVFKKIKIICPEHGEFEQMSDKHIKGHGCPICRESKGEREIRKILLENNIKFIGQYKFNDCRDKQPLPFDFYLPDYNMCIEYDGRQHYEPIDRWGGIKGLIDQQKKDNIKNMYCYNRKIKLIRISYIESIYKKLKEIKNNIYVIHHK